MGRKKKQSVWYFSPRRRESLKKAQRIHRELVELGKRARARGIR